MKKFFSFLIFLAVIACSAIYVAPVVGQKLDMPFEAGKLQAPAIERHHEAGHETEGHEAPAHEEAPAESHS
ncbi:MAG: hypothetical protein AB7E32_10815 [Desulfovibrio sp.]